MQDIAQFISVAKGSVQADLLLENCNIVNLFSGVIKKENIAIFNGYIIGFGNYTAKKNIDMQGQFIAPGFIDGHVHIESSMLSPEQFAYSIIIKGTTTIIADPHEIVNVLGLEGLSLFIERSQNLPVDIYFMMPSCVPATHLETSAFNISSAEMAPWLENKRILGLGEMMNFPGVIYEDTDVLNKILLYKNKIIDGHAPLLRGKQLSAYISAGISSDHESSTFDESLEKLEKGMFTLIREGSAAKNLDAILPLVNQHNSRFFGFCTDDRHPDFLVDKGHINHIVKKAMRLGMNPITAFQLSSLNIAKYYNLKNTGSLGIGYKADFIVFDNFDNLNIKKVFKNGELVVENGELIKEYKTNEIASKNTINIPELNSEIFNIVDKGKKNNIIELIPNQIITKKTIASLKSKNNHLIPDIENDILKISVIERHLGTGKSFSAFVKGFGLNKGAICSTVAHDSHNLIILGTNDQDMLKCVDVIREMKGGLAVVYNGEILASLALPFGGIMSEKSLLEVKKDYDKIIASAKELGCKIQDPFMKLSFLALPVIPEIKITDKGLVDVNKFDFISIYQEN